MKIQFNRNKNIIHVTEVKIRNDESYFTVSDPNGKFIAAFKDPLCAKTLATELGQCQTNGSSG